MESHILITLNFQLQPATPFRFLEKFTQMLHDCNESTFLLGRYLIELCLIEYKTLTYRPSLLAGCAIFLASRLMQNLNWNEKTIPNFKIFNDDSRQCI